MSANGATDRPKRTRVSQADIPAYTLDEAMRVPLALRDQYGKSPTRPLSVAVAMDLSPNSSHFRMLTGAAVAYGLTDGGAQADLIGLTALGRRTVAPTSEGDDAAARREAALKPRIMREFLAKYDGNRLPNNAIALNVLEEMGVPAAATARALEMILQNARSVGLLREVKGNTYVELDGGSVSHGAAADAGDAYDVADDSSAGAGGEAAGVSTPAPLSAAAAPAVTRRVFITHGRNREIVGQLKEVLTFGGFTPVISVETESIAKGVTEKVMDEMRSCGAAVIHVGTEKTLLDSAGTEHKIINQNVLIEIGAALALYNRRFILLVERGTELPSNLQGLYEVRYEGDRLDYDATMKLLKAFNDFRGE